jgi:exosortase/archaeosortase family protein
LTRAALSLAAVFGLLHLAGTTDVLSDLTRPLVVAVLELLGVAAADRGGHLVVGRLHVPWTRDCAGLNVLAVLWAVALWVNRAEPLSRRTWGQLALAVPVAFAANVARILTLIAYRAAFFPAVESPQLHYFIGFLWIVPFLGLWVPRGKAAGAGRRLEILYLAAALALITPHVGGPGGSLVTLAALLFLAESRLATQASPARRWWGVAWLLAALPIAAARMESLWTPWLLLCPWFAAPSLLRSPHGLVLLVGTIPLAVLNPVGRVAVLAAAAWQAWRLVRGRRAEPAQVASEAVAAWRPAASAALVGALVFPFVASVVAGRVPLREPPPAGTMARPIDATSYTVRLVGQSPEIELAWFGPYGEGRHHTLPVCMRYRGVVLGPSEEDGVMTDGGRWMREFFLHDGALLADYPAYLLRTSLPFSSPGVHVIASAPTSSMSARSFGSAAERLARELHRLGGDDLTAGKIDVARTGSGPLER